MAALTLDFLAGLAHELRTPLGAIGGYAELMELGVHGPVTPAQMDGLQRIRKNQQLMVSLISAFMAYAEVAEGEVQLQREPVALAQAMRDALDGVESRAHEKSIDLVVEHESYAADLRVLGDAGGVETLLAELLRDAVESTGTNGEVRLTVSTSADTVSLEVTSTGEMIPPSAAELAFVPFDRGGKGNRVSAAPHALSLPHARALARAMDGEVAVVPGSFLRSIAVSLPRAI
jgi:signal transduction histidine kinase